MRRFLLLVLICFVFASCSNEDDFGLESTQFIYESQAWSLVSMEGSVVGSKTTGDEMDWQEEYLFAPNGTFVKSRTVNNTVMVAKGIFEVVEYEKDPLHYLELTYETGMDLIGSCTGGKTEVLVYRSINELSNTWQACDGPGLNYKIVQD